MSGKLNPNVNLVDTLNGGEFTVFAPTDAAFAKIDPATIEKLKTDSDLLNSILTYHVVPGQASPAKVAGMHKTVQGADVTVTGRATTSRSTTPGVVCGGVRTANATVYMIDTVLMPPASSAGTVGHRHPSARGLSRRAGDPALALRITDMFTLVLIGFLGGLITGISPCILPVLPVIFFSGAQTRPSESPAETGSGGRRRRSKPNRSVDETLRPYRVIGGLVLSFSLVTLVGNRAAVAAASSAGRDPVGRAGRADRHRSRPDLSRGSRRSWKGRSPAFRSFR